MNNTETTIGSRIKEERIKHKMTQEMLAEKAHISLNHLAKIETGKRRPSLQVSTELCEALGISLDYLIRGKTPKESEIMSGCSPKEKRVIATVITTLKEVLKIYEKKNN